jgi:predicted enzyme related to lactoylglutathione lyase
MPAIELFLVELRTGDRTSLAAWYAGKLGLKTVLEDGPGDYTLLAAGPTRIAIKGGRAGVASGSIGLVFRVDDVDSERARLVSHGVEVSETEESPEGYRAIHLADPVGHRIQLFEWVGSSPTGLNRRPG